MAGYNDEAEEFFLKDFINKESAAGLILIAAAIMALIIANTSLSAGYQDLLNLRIVMILGDFSIDKTALLWINDGLMALFFFLIALEVKREVMVGQFRDKQAALFPLVAAIGGMVIPALLFVGLNLGNSATINGWAVPAATDIAFALGILALMGSRAPMMLKTLLLAIAIIDDIGAILIVALFYTENIALTPLCVALIPLVGLILANRLGVASTAPYVILGTILWVCILKSGVHATIAAVITGFMVPLYVRGEEPLERIEHALHPWVAFMVLPIFAFANAGLVFGANTLDGISSNLSLGIIAGLVIGKPIGIFGLSWLAVRIGLVNKPDGLSWMQILGLSCLAGVGFTMSLFIGGLAFSDPLLIEQLKLGVIVGSTVSALLAVVILAYAAKQRSTLSANNSIITQG
ncbi:Na+/H+ antiporter NhaA [Parasphingorhabdus sp. DH2-15]|uniref:Na+/H+ antiporter NhaA n=1 Tax=Parasphingorhabdus sp. DH2-15 TaxID=3444112 RepID=UPI003F6830A6